MTQKKRVGIAIPIHLYNTLREEAEYNGFTINGLICQIFREWIEREKGIKTTNKTD